MSDKTRKYFLAGQSGCGKTTLLKALAAREDRVVHWDIEDEYRGEQITFADIPRLAKRRAFCVVYRPHFARSLEDLPREFEQFAGLLLKYGRQLTVTIDEALSVLPRNRTSGGLGALLYQGRKRGLSVYYATQEISGLPRALTGQAKKLFVFHLDSGGDLQVLRRYLAPDLVRRVAALPPHEYLTVTK